MFAETVDLLRAFESVTEHWSPKVVAQVNNQFVKLAKVQGEFVWHKHDEEDELFYVLRGTLRIHYQGDRIVTLPPGSMHVVPKGVLHNPVAEEECWIMLVETVSTQHTGDVITPRTRAIQEQLS